MTGLRDAWTEIYYLLPELWLPGSTSFDADRQRWSVTARGPSDPSRPGPPASVTGEGEDELAALDDLARQLRKLPEVQRRILDDRRAGAGNAGRLAMSSGQGGWLAIGVLLTDSLFGLARRLARADRLRALRARRRRREEKRRADAPATQRSPRRPGE